MSIHAAGGGVRLGDDMTQVKIWQYPGAGETRWVLSVNGFIIRIDADRQLIREAAKAYYLRGKDPIGEGP